MNTIDIILLIPLLFSAYKGYSKGFVTQAATLAALVLGIYGAIVFSSHTAELLREQYNWQTEYLPLIAFSITFLAIVLVVHIVAKIVDSLLKAIALGFINRLAGLVFGIIKMGFILSIIIVILTNIDKKYSFLPHKKTEESFLYQPLSQFAPLIFPYLDFNEIEKSINKPNIKKTIEEKL